MNTKTPYTFSLMVKSKVAYLEKRPWWAFWRHDKLVEKEEWVRRSILVTEQEKDLIVLEEGTQLSPSMALVYKALISPETDAKDIQLEKNFSK